MAFSVFADFWPDLNETRIWWQVGVALLSVLLGYLLARLVQWRFPVDETAEVAEARITRSFMRVMFPALSWALMYLGKVVLHKFQHVHLLSLLLPIIGSLALIRFSVYLSRRIFSRSAEAGDVHILLERIFSWGVWLIVILYYTGLLPDIVEFLDDNVLSFGHAKLTLSEILQGVVSVALTVLVALWAGAALENRLMKVSSLHSSLRLVLGRLARGLLILFAVLVSMSLVGIDLTVLSVFGGALGVGLGLGLQKIASNYVSGFIILLDRSLSIDDLITVDKYSGKVSRINTRYTVLKGLDGVESIIPNEMLVSSPVQNLSLTDRAVWMSTDISVAYDTDIEALFPALIEAVKTVPRISVDSEPSANLVSFGQSGLDIKIGFWIVDPENGKLAVMSGVNRAIWKLLKELQVVLPYPQREVRILNADVPTE